MPLAGEPCACPDGHRGKHRTAASIKRWREHNRTPEGKEYFRKRYQELMANDAEYRERRRTYNREYQREYSKTVAGLAADIRGKISKRRKRLVDEF